jgi:O-antigen/teichoic acid export membrane protein
MSSNSKSSFFRQSGWMVVSTFLGGIFMVGVQIAAQDNRVMETSDSTIFVALLGLLIIFGGVPSSALQTIFAQQAAAAVTDQKERELTAALRALLRATFILWFVLAGLMIFFAGPVSSVLDVKNPEALRVAMLAVLAVVWLPTFKGVLQGQHRFAPLGWLQIMEGALRLGIFFLLVLRFKCGAAGGLWAVFAGSYLTLAFAMWLTRDVWLAKISAPFSWKNWLIQGAPLTLAIGAFICMSSLDRVFTKSLILDPVPVKLYNNAMLVGFAIVQFIAPITSVMFPTIVRSLALSKKSDALLLTLAVTGIFGCLAAVGCALFPKLPLAVLHFKMEAAPLVPWFAWAVLPLTLANVLIQSLMARRRYVAAQWLILVPVCYGLTLMALAPALVRMRDVFSAFRAIIQTLGCFSLLLFAVAAWFSWGKQPTGVSDPDSAGER